jgi:hypothetical protein
VEPGLTAAGQREPLLINANALTVRGGAIAEIR